MRKSALRKFWLRFLDLVHVLIWWWGDRQNTMPHPQEEQIDGCHHRRRRFSMTNFTSSPCVQTPRSGVSASMALSGRLLKPNKLVTNKLLVKHCWVYTSYLFKFCSESALVTTNIHTMTSPAFRNAGLLMLLEDEEKVEETEKVKAVFAWLCCLLGISKIKGALKLNKMKKISEVMCP